MSKAVGILELSSIAKGMETGDAMLKSANVELLVSKTLCPGKFLLMLGGDVGAVQQAINSGASLAGEMLVDSLVLPNIHPSLLTEWGHLMCRVEFDLHIAHERRDRLFVHTQLRWHRCAGVTITSLFRAEAPVQTMAHPDTTGLSQVWLPAVLRESVDNLPWDLQDLRHLRSGDFVRVIPA